MMLAEKHDIIKNDKEIADLMNNYLNITKNLRLKRNLIHASQLLELEFVMYIFKHHKNIQRIKLANI